jgi:hypothetical protein
LASFRNRRFPGLYGDVEAEARKPFGARNLEE